jgi:hypothetical protein
MASTDARPVPIKNTAFRLTFAMRLNTGSVNSGAAGVQAKVSKDGGTFANTTNAPTEIATSSGIYFLDLTATEMNADCVAITVTSSTTNAVTFSAQLYPTKSGAIPVDVDSINTSTTAADAQQALADSAPLATVDTGTFTATATDFETSLVVSVATDFYKGRSVIFLTGALAKQAARITGSTYTGNSKVRLTVTSLTAAPANAVQFAIV